MLRFSLRLDGNYRRYFLRFHARIAKINICVRTGTKKFGGFGSGGRRDAMMLAKARKAKEEKLKQQGAQTAAAGSGESAKRERVSKWGAKAGGATDW